MIKTLILEDEIPARNRLISLLDSFEKIEIQASLDSVESAINWLKVNDIPDLAFFDIQLADGMSFEIFDYLDDTFPVIFTTAYDQYALKAFESNGIDYLLKPITLKSVKSSLEKLSQISEKWKSGQKNVANYLQEASANAYRSRFLVKAGEKLSSIPVEKIQLFYSFEKSTRGVTVEDRKCLIDMSLDKVYEGLNPDVFFRINRQQIINISNIGEIFIHSNSRLKIKLKVKGDQSEFIVARDRVKEFKEWLDR